MSEEKERIEQLEKEIDLLKEKVRGTETKEPLEDTSSKSDSGSSTALGNKGKVLEIEKKITTNEKAILALAIGLAISSFLPWASVRWAFGTVDLTGLEVSLIGLMEGEGMFIPILGAFLCLIILVSDSHAVKKGSSVAIGVVCGLVTIAGYFRLSSVISEVNSEYVWPTIGIGLYLAILVNLGLIVFGIIKDKEEDITEEQPGNIEEKLSDNEDTSFQ